MNQTSTQSQLNRMANHPAIQQLVRQPRDPQADARMDLGFSQVVSLLLTGAKVRRLAWSDRVDYMHLPTWAFGQLQVVDQDGRTGKFELQATDSEATDWYVVEGE